MRNNSLKVVLVLAIVCYALTANSFNEENVSIAKQISNTDTVQVIAKSDSLFVRGKSLYEKKEYKAAIDYFLKSDSVINAYYGEDCPYYGYGKKWVSCCFHELGMDSIALEYSIYYDKQPIDKLLTHSSDSVIWIALRLIDLGQIKNAAEKLSEAALLEKQELGQNSYWYANTLSVCSGLYSEIGNFGKAIELGKEAVEIYKTTFGPNNSNYATCLNNLATCYADNGNDNTAIKLYLEALEIKKRLAGTELSDYADDLSNLAESYSAVGNNIEALRIGTEAMNIRKKILGTEHSDYAISLSCLANYYSAIGNNPEALRLGTEAMNIWKKNYGPQNFYYAMSLKRLAIYYSNVGNYTKALQTGTEAMGIQKEILGAEDPNYATTFGNIALYNFYLGNYEEAIRIGKESLELDKKVFGIEHPNYMMSLTNLAFIYLYTGNYEAAYGYMKQYIDRSQSYILNNFVESTSNLRESLWISKFASHYIGDLPNVVDKYQNKESISKLYDWTCLFANGILLNSDMKMRKLILESGDSVLITKYNKLSSNISIYNKLIETPIDKRFADADSLNNVIQRQEMELAKDSKAYGDYTHNLVINWKDVQRGLCDNDIAIEFLNYPIYKTDSIVYIALTLKKNYDSPHFVKLFDGNHLKTISENDYYTQTDVSDLIWKPLNKELEGVKNIYFSPSGELHRIGIEYLPMSNEERMCDKYTLHRLSSTRQLALIQDETKGEQNILYGGIDYDIEYETANVDTTQKSILTRDIPNIYRANVDSLALRASYEYLEGTKKEADQIAADMEKHHVPYLYLYGKKGSEESFKKLNGTKPKLIHIATHGFYMTEDEVARSSFANSQMETIAEDNQRGFRLFEDKHMSRSGLLFLGSNHAINHETIPDGAEDGILTAQEISTLDLRGLDLVVLSACQTGLGDIISGEGVFGLQRGFKKAGAKTIIMSLWKVNDDSTMKLMTYFYHHYLDGMSKEEAFHAAQNELRKECPSQQERPDWAAFILLDGLN